MLQVPPDVAAAFRQFLLEWRVLFARPAAYKNSFRTLSLKGSYMTPFPGLHEVFEHKEVNRDSAYRCPAECDATTKLVFDWCQSTAVMLLHAMLDHVGAVKRAGTAGDNLGGLWKFQPESTLRILHYDKVVSPSCVAALM
jgi:hypothetical protein